MRTPGGLISTTTTVDRWSGYLGIINSFHGRLKIWKSIFAAGFAIDNYSFLAAFELNRLDTLSMVF